MLKTSRCTEMHPETNGWYALSSQDFNKILELDMVPVKEVQRMAAELTEKSGDFDEQLADFAAIKFEDGCKIEVAITAIDVEEKYVTVAVGQVEFCFDFIIKKSKLESVKGSIFLGLQNSWITVNEVPGVAAFLFLQAYAKYLLGELEDMEWVDPVYD